MTTQPEQVLEDNLVDQLTTLGYERVTIRDEDALLANLKNQLEKHNKVTFSDAEFARVLNHLDKGNEFQRAKTLRDKFNLRRDDETNIYIEFLNMEHWCRNQYQVTQQVKVKGKYDNRYDVTLLVNGLPLVQIELKRRGLELKEAFNQVNRYHRHSYWAGNGLFKYVQIFVISNGVNTKYYANNRRQTFKQTFYWADRDNNLITQLNQFAEAFLEKCHVSKMICKYIVLHESDKLLMVLRPYQYYAVEALVDRVKNTEKNGYIWHTTGSGKTLTSFKAAQILDDLPTVEKVVFCVDRADLDYQTAREFNYFSEGSVDSTSNTAKLVNQLTDDTRLIVTTIQKLNTAIHKKRYRDQLEKLANKRIVFIFDECHRSQFGETHKRIKEFFTRAQMFGFTGTPILEKNAVRNELGKRTTKDLFDLCLHKYVITNAISDENVLKFSVEYWGKLKRKDGGLIDEEVAGINTKEFFENEDRISGIVDWIIANHDRKTHNRAFSAMFCVSSVEALTKYYEAFKTKKEAGQHGLRVATIFTYTPNEEDADADGNIPEPDFDIRTEETKSKHSRDLLNDYIADYNAMYGTKHSANDSKGFYAYYKDIAKRIKEREKDSFDDKDRVDILLVVNMYLTGFDAKKLNTLYVDKNLKYHGLVQAFSRTNRILGDLKSHGNIVCFRNLKKKTDEAIALFSNPNASEVILMEPYGDYVEQFNEALAHLFNIAPTVDSVNELPSEKEELAFVQAFRQLIRLKNILGGFSDFTFEDLDIEEQTFEDYKSKYLDIYDKTRNDSEGEQSSIINDIDFELELIQRDEINVAYILALLADLHKADQKTDAKSKKDANEKRKAISDLLGSEAQLRSKKELIERFIAEHMPKVKKGEDVAVAFKAYWTEERQSALATLCEEEGLRPDQIESIIESYHFTGQTPLRDTVVAALVEKPKVLERKKIVERVTEKIIALIRRFDDDMGAV
ncbi:type I restriction endonuclease subunit R [Hyphococcus lacteus]|uniref:Type I restriction enzyme endonuclease subunit n=1 Tax=Hyphococcus lacteus TaxID=3143536 RepID=A0ABV3Z2E8_9PROT